MKDFAHLHLHSEYSLLDGACRLDDLVARVKELGQSAVAVTDHGVMFGAVEFYKKATKAGIKPIIGCEVYVAPRTRFDKDGTEDRRNFHLILLCKNNLGYKNLIKMVSKAHVEGFYAKPRIDHNLLVENHDGLIAMSACLGGEIAQYLLNGMYEKAKKTALFYKGLFGEDYYLEIQDHGIEQQARVNPLIVKLARELDIQLVATNDAHYLTKEDSKTQHILLCIQTNKTINDEIPLEFPTDEFYVKSREEMEQLFPNYPEALDNTLKIADKCNVDFTFGKILLPHFEVPDNRDHFEYFTDMCFKGLKERYGDNPGQDKIDRLNYELGIIHKMGYVDYYLIVHDFVNYAKSVGIPVGPGRGSGAGSIAAYAIGITGIDPIKYNLLFERFLNPERVSMPDFDIDFCVERRQEVIEYVKRKYGDDHVAQIVTFGTMAAKGAVRDVGRALGMSYAAVDEIAKLIPFAPKMTIDKAFAVSKELKARYDSDESVHQLIDIAKRVEGMPRHSSIHAAGVVITPEAVDTYVPLVANDGMRITQYVMTTLEELGLLKMDFLGLRNLTVIRAAENLIRSCVPDFDINKIDTEDKAVFEMLTKGDTQGVFQFESDGMRNVLVSLKPVSIEDLIAVISLYRPGPMDSIPKYINNRHHPDQITYKTPLLKDILDVTNGCIVYQEQVMQIFQKLAGYSFGRADIVRRAMGKKKHDVMAKEETTFIDGCKKNGIDGKIAKEIFDEMESFASYAFNKSHAAAYAVVAYQTAYLKCHFPKEYMTALLSSVLDNTSKVTEYIMDCEDAGIKVLPPTINNSFADFRVEGDNIRFGLLAVKNIGRNFIARMEEERQKGGKFTSLYDFCDRLYGKDFNRRTIENLIKCGAMDCLNENRKTMLMASQDIISKLEATKNNMVEGQLDLFSLCGNDSLAEQYKMKYMEEFPRSELLAMEKEITGLYLTGHPMNDYLDVYKAIKADRTDHLTGEENKDTYKDGCNVKIFGIVTNVVQKTTRNNQIMAFVTMEDMYGSIEVLVFPQTYEYNGSKFEPGAILVIEGKLSAREEEDAKVICNKVSAPPTKEDLIKNSTRKNESKNKIYIRLSSVGCDEEQQIKEKIAFVSGQTPLYLYYSDVKKYKLAAKVELSTSLIDDLKELLGDKDVVVK